MLAPQVQSSHSTKYCYNFCKIKFFNKSNVNNIEIGRIYVKKIQSKRIDAVKEKCFKNSPAVVYRIYFAKIQVDNFKKQYSFHNFHPTKI